MTTRIFCLAALAALGCSPEESVAGDPATLTSLSLTPAAVSISTGASQQFEVAGTWSDNGTTPPSVEFSATGGTVTAAGIYTAGTAAGTYRVIARHAESGLADTSTVTVTAPNPAAVILVDERFEDNNGGSRGWYDNLNWTTTTAEHIPGSTRSLEIRWNQGQTLPVFGGTSRHLFTPTSTLYVRYWVKYSANWVGSGLAYHPHEFQILTNQSNQWLGPSFTNLTTYIENRYLTAGGVPVLGMTDGANIITNQVGQDLTAVTENRAVAGCNGNSDGKPTDCYPLGGGNYNNGKWIMPPANEAYFLPAAGPRYKNDWHLVEVVLRLNTIQNGIGQLDGVAEYWFDGQRVINERGLLFRTGEFPSMQWNQFIIGPYIGPGSPVAQSIWIDDLLIATAKP